MATDTVNVQQFTERSFNYGRHTIRFATIRDPQQLPHSVDRLWALEWKSAFAFAEFLLIDDKNETIDLNGLTVLEVGA
jgi:hypothetical protein